MGLPTDIPVKADRNRLLLIPKLVTIGAAVLAASEASWRFTGVERAHSDLLDFDRLYAAARDLSNAVVLIGSSRVLCDLDPGILKRELPKWEFYQLAIDGTSPLPMLEHLALDAKFHGHVLCDFNTGHFMEEYPFRENEFHQLQYVQFIQRRPYSEFLQTWFLETLKEDSALVGAQDQGADFFVSLKARVASIFRNRSELSTGLPPKATRRDDRFLGLDNRDRDNSRAIAWWAQMDRRAIARWAQLDSGGHGSIYLLQRVAAWVEEIRRRGGDVVFIRMPVSGSLKRLEDEAYPDRDRFIQSLAGRGINVIESAKEPTLRGFDCPDESHLDADDAGRFSTALARILEDRQLLTRARPAPISRE